MNSPTSIAGNLAADPALCPVCQSPNDCQLCTSSTYKGSCWCQHHSFPEELLARVPEELRNRACVCRSCVETAWRARRSPKPGAGDFYPDPRTSLLVFTGQYLKRRGYCCDSGCRHCPWERPTEGDRAKSGGVISGVQSALLLTSVLGMALGTAGSHPGRAETVTEDFATDPATREWRSAGASELYQWNAASGWLDVTWDSSKPQSFFARPLGATLGTNDAFAFAVDLVLTEATGGVRPPRTGAMQIALGLLDLDRATREHYPRAAGKAFDLLEFNWFPQGEFPGFGVVDATVSPAVFSTAGRVAASFTFPLEPTPGVTHRVRCEFQPAARRWITRLISDGVEVAVRPVSLPEDFGSFSINAFAVINWSDADGPFDSLLARGHLDNLTWEIPDAPLRRIKMPTPGSVTFASQAGWHYRLEASGDLTRWDAVADGAGIGGTMSLHDLRDAVFTTQFYRVQAQPE